MPQFHRVVCIAALPLLCLHLLVPPLFFGPSGSLGPLLLLPILSLALLDLLCLGSGIGWDDVSGGDHIRDVVLIGYQFFKELIVLDVLLRNPLARHGLHEVLERRLNVRNLLLKDLIEGSLHCVMAFLGKLRLLLYVIINLLNSLSKVLNLLDLLRYLEKLFFKGIEPIVSVGIEIHEVLLELCDLRVDLLLQRKVRERLGLVVLLAFKLVQPLVLGFDGLFGLSEAVVEEFELLLDRFIDGH